MPTKYLRLLPRNSTKTTATNTRETTPTPAMDQKFPSFRSARLEHAIPAPRGWAGAHETAQLSPHAKIERSENLDWPSSPKSIRESSFDSGCPLPRMELENSEETRRRSSSPWVWELNKVHQPPVFYPAEEWNTTVVEHLSLGTIAARISEFLRSHSIAAEYNDQDGYVRCRTLEHLEFVVNIWQDRNSPSFLVHVQHVGGCSMELHRMQSALRHAILDSATQEEKRGSRAVVAPVRVIPSSLRVGAAVVGDGSQVSRPPSGGADSESPLEFCKCLLQSQLWSEKRLGLESLAVLADGSKTIPSAVRQASSAVLSDPCLQNMLLQNLTSATRQRSDDWGRNKDENNILALRIILGSLENSEDLPNTAGKGAFLGSVLSAVLENIRGASARPLEACLSVRCLGRLDELSFGGVLADIDLYDLERSLRHAHQFGRQHNLALQTETELLFGRLSSALAR